MSYDLHFNSTKSFTQADFESHFASRPNYSVEQNQAWYENPDTGVYFSFDFEFKSETGDHHPVTFFLDYMRPTYFAQEAQPEITAFIKAFNLTVKDPQDGGMTTGKFDTQNFFQIYKEGNQHACQEAGKTPKGISVLPTLTLQEAWLWNYARLQRQNSLPNHLYVPKIIFVGYKGQTTTAITWPDAIPTLIPKVDLLIIPRAKLAPRKFLIKVKNTATITHDAFNYMIEKHTTKPLHNAALLDYQEPPQNLQQAITDLPRDSGSLEILLSNDQVLDAELF